VFASEPEEGVLVVFFQEGLEEEDRFAAQKMGVVEYETALVMAGSHHLTTTAPAFEDGFDVLFILEGHAGAVKSPVDDADFHGAEGFVRFLGVFCIGVVAALDWGVPALAFETVDLAHGFGPELELFLEGTAFS